MTRQPKSNRDASTAINNEVCIANRSQGSRGHCVFSCSRDPLFLHFFSYSTRNQEHVFAPPFPAPQSAPPCKLPPAPIYVSSRGDFRTTGGCIPERSGRWAWGFPRGKKGNRVNTISVRLALANNSDDPYRSYFIILHISLRELFWRGVQQPHETGGVEMKNKKVSAPNVWRSRVLAMVIYLLIFVYAVG